MDTRQRLRIALVIDWLGFQEVYSLPIVSAIAKKAGHEVALFEYGPNPKRAVHDLTAYQPDIVGYSVSSNEHQRYLEINRRLKSALRFFSLFGGPHPTFFPDYVRNEGVDAICRGEADVVLPRLLERFGREEMYRTENFWFQLSDGRIVENPLADLVEDLDTVPPIDRDLLYAKSMYMAKTPIKGVFTGRGCPYKCSYCFNHAYNSLYRGKGRVIRRRSVQAVLDEIQEIRRRYPLKLVRIMDDTFGLNCKWMEEFATRYPREIGLPFTCQARPNLLTDQYCDQLQRAGCHGVFMAIECANEHLRNEVANRRISTEQIQEACRRLKCRGIRVATYNMVGMPGETEQDLLATIELNRVVGADYAEASILQPYPGTAINEYCRRTGHLEPENEAFQGQYSTTVLKFNASFRQKLFVFHRLFPVLVDRPWSKRLIPLLSRLPSMNKMLDVVYRLYYGVQMHRRMYGSQIPLSLRAAQAMRFLTVPSRS